MTAGLMADRGQQEFSSHPGRQDLEGLATAQVVKNPLAKELGTGYCLARMTDRDAYKLHRSDYLAWRRGVKRKEIYAWIVIVLWFFWPVILRWFVAFLEWDAGTSASQSPSPADLYR